MNAVLGAHFSLLFLVLVVIVFYLFVFILKDGVANVDPVLVRILLSVSCTILAATVLIFTMLPKLSIFTAKLSKIAELQSGAKPFLDDLGKPGDREKMDKGTKAEKLMVCSEHILLWHAMLNKAQKSSESASGQDSNRDVSRSVGKPSKG